MSKSSYKLIGLIVFIGFIATLFLIGLQAIYPEGGQFHDYSDRAEKAPTLTAEEAQINIYYIIVDNFFIIGYTAIFYGLYRLVQNKETEFWAKFALSLGLVTVFTDLVENGFVVAINKGIVAGFQPDSLIWGFMWIITAIKDISSYMSAFLFVILLIYTYGDNDLLKSRKFLFVLLLAAYAFIGSLGLFSQTFFLLRSLLFVIDLLFASIIFYTIKSD